MSLRSFSLVIPNVWPSDLRKERQWREFGIASPFKPVSFGALQSGLVIHLFGSPSRVPFRQVD